jgi:hypothetical protein
MPTQSRIIHATDFLIATPQGQVDLENSKRILLKLAAATDGDGRHQILLDVRKAETALSATDLWQLAREVSNRHTPFDGKIAVLCRADRANQAAFFALCAQNQGFPVHAFTSFEEAVEWLVASGPPLVTEIE